MPGIGVIGCGSVLAAYMPLIEKLHYRGIARPVLFADRKPQAEERVAQEYGGSEFTREPMRLIDDPRVEIVIILTSMLEHAALATAALEAGKHVLVEKPLATTLKEGATLAVVTAGFTMQQYRSPALEIYDSQGAIQMSGDDWDPDGYELWQNPVGAWQAFKESDPNWSWCNGLNHLVDCIRHGAAPLITPEHAYHVLEIMLCAKETGNDGQAHIVESSFSLPAFGKRQDGLQAHQVHDRTHQ
jgi:predicted dehydrogenase